MCHCQEKGFTLLEVIISMLILSIGIMALYTMQIAGIKGNATANRITAESTWGAGQIETMITAPYDDSKWDDSDGDGTSKDTNGDGLDDLVKEFGLADLKSATADGSFTTPDKRYDVLWNVATDVPIPFAKTVRVIVTSKADGKKVQFQYVKTDPLDE